MYKSEIKAMSQAAVKKVEFLDRAPLSYVVLSALAGIYVAFGIGLIFMLGAPLAAAGSPFLKLAMSATFGIALTLVVFAGSELFTGNNMFGVVAALNGTLSWKAVGRLWIWCYAGNLLGSLLLAWLFAQSGVFAATPQLEFIQKVVTSKMGAPLWPLFVRGILANWLVCLAVWSAARTSNDGAKIALIYMCLMAFIAPGFEHSIANMSLLATGLFQPHGEAITWTGYVRNLIPVTLGNMLGGGLFVGALYWFVSPAERVKETATSVELTPELVSSIR